MPTANYLRARVFERFMENVDHDDGSLKFVTLSLFTFAALLLVVWNVARRPKCSTSRRTVAILVLGDIGRSPRMMYHAESFAKHNFETYLIGYGGKFHSHFEVNLSLNL